MLAQSPAYVQGEVARYLKEIFAVSLRETSEALAQGFADRWRKRLPQAVKRFEQESREALAYLGFSRVHHRRMRTTNELGRLFQEMKRWPRVIWVFSDERSLSILTGPAGMRVTEYWALRRYLDMKLLQAQDHVQQGVRKFLQLLRL